MDLARHEISGEQPGPHLLITGGVSNPNDPAIESLRGKRAIPAAPVGTPPPTAQLNPRPE